MRIETKFGIGQKVKIIATGRVKTVKYIDTSSIKPNETIITYRLQDGGARSSYDELELTTIEPPAADLDTRELVAECECGRPVGGFAAVRAHLAAQKKGDGDVKTD